MSSEKNQLELKKAAAEYAVQFVNSGMVVGLGHGSTAIHAIRKVSQLLKDGELKNILTIPCSLTVETEVRKLGMPTTTLDDHPCVDITIDGADEVDANLYVIKGGGGALLREKIVAQATQREIIVVDESKVSEILGTRWAVPLEVVPFGLGANINFLEALGAEVSLRKKTDGSAFISDQGNLIVDAYFGPIYSPNELAKKLSSRAGIVEHGLFLNVVTDVVIARQNGIEHLQKAKSL